MLPLHAVEVGGQRVVTLCDSGSNVNMVSDALIDRLGWRDRVDRLHTVEWEGTTGGKSVALGSITLRITPPSDCGIVTAVPIICFVAPSLPGGVELLLRCPASSPAPQPFWRWRLGESRRVGLMPTPPRAPRARARPSSAGIMLAAALAALATTSAYYPTPTPAAFQRFLSGEYELSREDEGDGDPTLAERVADAAMDARVPVDFATVDLKLAPDTPPAEESALRSLLAARAAAFELQPGGIDCTPVRLPVRADAVPRVASQMPRSVRDPVRLSAMRESLDKLLDLGIIRRCTDADSREFAGQVVMVGKKVPGTWRLTTDHFQFNEIAEPGTHPLPSINDCLESVSGARRFFTGDLRLGFHQLNIDTRDVHRTRFVTPFGDFVYLRLPMGVRPGSSHCQRVVEEVFAAPIVEGAVSDYVDDVLGTDKQWSGWDVLPRSVAAMSPAARALPWTPSLSPDGDGWVRPPGVSDDFSNMLRNLNHVLLLAISRRLAFALDKSSFNFVDVPWLGQLVTPDGRRINPERYQALREMGRPLDKKQLVSFVALASYYRDFVPRMAELLAPLHDLTAVDRRFVWTAEHDASFAAVVAAICNAAELVHLDWDHPFTVVTDASSYAIGAVLLTGPPGAQRPYAFISRKLSAPECKWHTTEKEGLAIFWAVTDKFAPLLWSRPFFLHTDHSNLEYMQSSSNARVRRWLTALSRFDFTLSYIKGETNVADAFSRVDPAAHPMHPAVHSLAVLSGFFSDAAPVSAADDTAPSPAPTSPPVFDGSSARASAASVPGQPMVCAGSRTRKAAPATAYDSSHPVAPARVVSTGGTRPIATVRTPVPSPVSPVSVPLSASWPPADLPRRLAAAQRAMPDSERQHWLSLPHRFVLRGGEELLAAELRDCNWAFVIPSAASDLRSLALSFAHDQPFAGHGGIDRTVQRLHDAHLTWATISDDVAAHVHSCLPCQQLKQGHQPRRHGLLQHVPASAPLERVEIDLLDLPKSYGDGYTHALVCVDVFTRFAVFAPLRDGTAATVLSALQTHLFAHLGFPSILQFDGGRSFDNALLRSFLERHGVEAHRTTPYNHKSQGAVERANRSVLDLLRTAVDGSTSQWADLLWSAMFAYNSAVHNSTGVAPFDAILRFKPFAPVDHLFGGAVTAPVTGDGVSPVADHVSATSPSTTPLYTTMAERSRRAAEKRKRLYDTRVSIVRFNPGDDVWVFAEDTDGTNKLASHWRGPRRVISAVPGSDVLYVVTAPPESHRAYVIVPVDHLRPCDASRLAESDRAIVNRRADTFIPERVIAHRGSPGKYEFLIAWRGWGDVRASWEPLAGRTTDGAPSGVGNVSIVRDYMAAHGLAEPVAAAVPRSRRRAARAVSCDAPN